METPLLQIWNNWQKVKGLQTSFFECRQAHIFGLSFWAVLITYSLRIWTGWWCLLWPFSVWCSAELCAYLHESRSSEQALVHTLNKHSAACLAKMSDGRLLLISVNFLSAYICFFSWALSLSRCFIVCRLEGIGLILITHTNILTSPLLSLHWSLVPKPLTSYWQKGRELCIYVSVYAYIHPLSYRRWHAVEIGDLLSWWL